MTMIKKVEVDAKEAFKASSDRVKLEYQDYQTRSSLLMEEMFDNYCKKQLENSQLIVRAIS